MKKGKYAKGGVGAKALILVLTVALLVGVSVGGTLAWLTDTSDEVVNTFTDSDIEITLTETEREYKMIPGWTIDKNPKVSVVDVATNVPSEDCWLFVKITESTTPDLDAYISYAIADPYDAEENADGWQVIQQENDAGEVVIGRKVYKTDATKAFSILGEGSYEDSMGTDDKSDDVKYTWADDQVLVLPSVTKSDMEDIDGTPATEKQPSLTFKAYAVQLFKTNDNGNAADTNDEFTATEAWAKAAAMSDTTSGT